MSIFQAPKQDDSVTQLFKLMQKNPQVALMLHKNPELVQQIESDPTMLQQLIDHMNVGNQSKLPEFNNKKSNSSDVIDINKHVKQYSNSEKAKQIFRDITGLVNSNKQDESDLKSKPAGVRN